MARTQGTNNIMIFIDGHYLEKTIQDQSDGKIDYEKLARYLIMHAIFGNRETPILIRAYYYDGKPDLKDVENFQGEEQENAKTKIENAIAIQDKKLKEIRNITSFDVRLGQVVLLKNLDFRQKGVDLLIGIDMITKAYENQFDIAILLAGDSDFLELVEAVKHIGPRVIGAYFEHNVRSGLTDSFDKRMPLTVESLEANQIIIE